MTKVIARVHPVHLMNADWAPGGRQPSDQAHRLRLWVRRKLAAIIHIYNRHCYYYSARIGWYSFYRPTKGGRLSRSKHCSKGAQPMLKTAYRSSCRDKHNCQWHGSNLDPLTLQSDALNTRLLMLVWCEWWVNQQIDCAWCNWPLTLQFDTLPAIHANKNEILQQN